VISPQYFEVPQHIEAGNIPSAFFAVFPASSHPPDNRYSYMYIYRLFTLGMHFAKIIKRFNLPDNKKEKKDEEKMDSVIRGVSGGRVCIVRIRRIAQTSGGQSFFAADEL
jgi:hypothetical protein